MAAIEKHESVVEAGQLIRSSLPSMFPEEKAQEIDEAVADLLNDQNSDRETAVALSEVLGQDPGTKDWLERYVEGGGEEGEAWRSVAPYDGISGDPMAIAAQRYVCPGGDFAWRRRSPGEPVPRCPTHDLELQLVLVE